MALPSNIRQSPDPIIRQLEIDRLNLVQQQESLRAIRTEVVESVTPTSAVHVARARYTLETWAVVQRDVDARRSALQGEMGRTNGDSEEARIEGLSG